MPEKKVLAREIIQTALTEKRVDRNKLLKELLRTSPEGDLIRAYLRTGKPTFAEIAEMGCLSNTSLASWINVKRLKVAEVAEVALIYKDEISWDVLLKRKPGVARLCWKSFVEEYKNHKEHLGFAPQPNSARISMLRAIVESNRIHYKRVLELLSSELFTIKRDYNPAWTWLIRSTSFAVDKEIKYQWFESALGELEEDPDEEDGHYLKALWYFLEEHEGISAETIVQIAQRISSSKAYHSPKCAQLKMLSKLACDLPTQELSGAHLVELSKLYGSLAHDFLPLLKSAHQSGRITGQEMYQIMQSMDFRTLYGDRVKQTYSDLLSEHIRSISESPMTSDQLVEMAKVFPRCSVVVNEVLLSKLNAVAG